MFLTYHTEQKKIHFIKTALFSDMNITKWDKNWKSFKRKHTNEALRSAHRLAKLRSKDETLGNKGFSRQTSNANSHFP